MSLNRNELMGFLFWGNVGKKCLKTMSELRIECDAMGIKNNNSRIRVFIYFFCRNVLKTKEDIDFMIKRCELEISDKGDKIGKIYGGYNYDQAISFAGIVMNISNLKYFNEICWKRFLDMQGDGGKLMLIGIRNYLLECVGGMDMKRFLIFSSMILFLYGLRNPNDVDILGYEKPNPDGCLQKLYNNYGGKQKRLLGFGELSIRGYGDWKKGGKKEYLNVWFGYEWARKFGAENMEDMIFNPRFYISILGLKIITLRADMERRKIRYRPASYADLIAYNRFMPEPMKIEPPPKKYIVGGEEKSYETDNEIKELLRKIKNYLKLRYDIRMTMKDIGRMLGVLEILEVKNNMKDDKIRKRIRIYDKLVKIR